MKIGIQTWGSEGDIRPLLGLGYGLVRAGHAVTAGIAQVDGHNTGLNLAKSLGIKALPIASEYFNTNNDKLQTLIIRLSRINNPIKQVKLILDQLYAPIQEAQYAVSKQLCANNDIVVGHFLVDTLTIAAEITKIPYASVMPVGTVRSQFSPPIGAPDLGHVGNRILWRLAAWVIQRQFGPDTNALRQREGLKPLQNVLEQGFGSQQLNIISNSPTLYPPQPDWSIQHKVCGYISPPSTTETLEPLLSKFLAAGPEPVYMTFGSMLTMPQPLTLVAESINSMLDAARLAGVRAIVQAPWQLLDTEAPSHAHIADVTPNILRLSRAEHAQIFPHCAAVVHHGGAGTTHATLVAGCPAVVVPHATDQRYWGQRLVKLGVATSPLARKKLTAQGLAQRIRAILANSSYKKQAQHLGKQMQTEDGIATATTWLETFARVNCFRCK